MLSWERKAGEPESLANVIDDMIVIGQPDWVMSPFGKLYIADRFTVTIPCPKGNHEATMKVMLFKDSDIACMECPKCQQFLWIRMPNSTQSTQPGSEP